MKQKSTIAVILLLLIHLFAINTANCQTTIAEDTNLFEKSLTVKFLPTTFFEPSGGLQLGAEYRFHQLFGCAMDAAWLNSRLSVTEFGTYSDGIYGYRIIPEIRYYDNSKNYKGLYVALQYLYKNQAEKLWVSTDRLNGSYAEMIQIEKFKKVQAFHLKFGFQENIVDNFFGDFYVGFGLRHLVLSRSNDTDADPFREYIVFGKRNSGTFTMPSFTAGLKIAYRIW